jgi:hypothetical protein
MKAHQNRREFIKNTSTGIIGIGVASGSLTTPQSVYGVTGKSTVAIVRNERSISNRSVADEKQAALMVDTALFMVTGKQKPEQVWSSLGVTKEDIVGIKVNSINNAFPLFDRSKVAYAISNSLSSVVPPNNIIIYDRYTAELTHAGYTANNGSEGVRCIGADEGAGFHPGEGITRIVTDMCTKIINIPALKTLDTAFAASLFIKNHVGSLPPDEMPKGHDNQEFITSLSALPSLKNKTILGVCDGLRGTYKRGVPWYWRGIIMSRDLIAAEYAAHQVINEKRALEKEKPLEFPAYVTAAETKYEIGTCNPANIDISKITM